MTESASSLLEPWSSFYVMTGSAAAALTGLMFVVITIVTGSGRPSTDEGIRTFSTPTVMHFCAALLVSAVLAEPFHVLWHAAACVALAGFAGLCYVAQIVRHTRRLSAYTPDLSDWLWYNVGPLIAYAMLLVGAAATHRAPKAALFAIAAGVLLLLFLGIRNAWDVVTFVAVRPDDPAGAPAEAPKPPS